jgi:PhnB protein
MKINPYLSFDGNCKEAFEFYQKTLGGKIAFMLTYGETPDAAKMPQMKDKIAHARLITDGNVLMGSDAHGECAGTPQGFSISINVDTAAEAERLFKALSEKGQVRFAMEETFWATRFGILVDQFDIPWMINCEKTS